MHNPVMRLSIIVITKLDGIYGNGEQVRFSVFVFKAHRSLYHSTLGLRVIKKKRSRPAFVLDLLSEREALGALFDDEERQPLLLNRLRAFTMSFRGPQSLGNLNLVDSFPPGPQDFWVNY